MRAQQTNVDISANNLANANTVGFQRSRADFKDLLVERLDPALLTFDLDSLATGLRAERDEQFTYMGLQTLYDRYLIQHQGRRLETPQYFWLRVAMGQVRYRMQVCRTWGKPSSRAGVMFHTGCTAWR